MIFFGHIGASLLGARLLAGKKTLDLGGVGQVAFWAVLPDLIDKTLFGLGLAPVTTGRLWAHTLLAGLVCCLFCRYILKSCWPWVLAMPGHLVLDSMWNRPHTLLWPFLGLVFDHPPYPIDINEMGYLGLWCWRWDHDAFLFGIELAMEGLGLLLAFFITRSAWTNKGHEECIPEAKLNLDY